MTGPHIFSQHQIWASAKGLELDSHGLEAQLWSTATWTEAQVHKLLPLSSQEVKCGTATAGRQTYPTAEVFIQVTDVIYRNMYCCQNKVGNFLQLLSSSSKMYVYPPGPICFLSNICNT